VRRVSVAFHLSKSLQYFRLPLVIEERTDKRGGLLCTSNRQRPPTKVPTVRFWLRLVTAGKLLKRLEAAIGIEPMNKGFAVLAKLVAQVQPRFLVSIFIRLSGISSLRVIS